MIRKDKKAKKYLGTRSRGAGNTKNRRGAGYKGGKGKAGRWKHKIFSYQELVGAKSRLKPKKKINAISLYDLNEIISKKYAKEKEIVLDFKENKDLKKYDKILGNGNINYKIKVKNVLCSEKAKEKILANGGSVE